VRPIALTASVALAVSLATCARESAGPPRHAAFSVAPVLPSGTSLAAFNLSVDNVRLIVVRPPADTVFDQTVAFPANQSSLPISADIPLEQSPETFQVTIQLLSGTTLLFAGTQNVSVTADQVTPPAQIPVTYSGPGQNVATLTIDPPDSVLTQGGTLQFRLTAKDAQGVIVPTFYASWTTSDTNVAKVDATGVLTAPLSRATVSVLAHTPNNVSATTPITFAPAATAISIVSGCNQGAPPGGQLPQPVVVRVIAGDQLGVKGVAVQFTAPPGGAVVPTQAVTDANGLVQTVVTLGATPGPTSLAINASGLPPVTCNQTVQTSATKLAITAQPTGSVTAGALFTVVVTAQDALGNTDASFAGTVTLALGANPGGTVYGPQTVAAVAGIATFGSVALDKAGTGYTLVATSGVLTPATTTPFTVIPAAPAQLVYSVQPTTVGAGSPITPAVVVASQDAFGNPTPSFVGSVTVALGANPGSATLGGTLSHTAVSGAATFADLTVNKVGSGYTLVASSSGLSNATSTSFNVTTVPATQLVFTTAPQNVTAGSAITPAVQVSAMDGFGNVNTSFTGAVTIALGSNPGGGVLSGTLTANAAAGVATFSDLSINKAGSGYTLAASSPGLVAATSTAFNVTTGAATQLAITTQPTNVTAGVAIAPAVTVEARDAGGNVTSTFTGNVTVALQANPGSGILSGTLTRAAVAGVATFNDLSLDKAANGYTLRVTSGALTAATSTTFNVSAGTATTLAFVTQPVSVLQGAPIAPPVTVAVQDGFGNTVPSAVNTITISIGTNPNGGTLTGTTSVAAVAGVASFANLSIDNPGTGYTLQAAATGFTPVVSAAFNVLPSGAGIAWINAAGGNWSNPANWSPARVPAKGDTVFITLGGTYTVTLDVNDTVAFLTVGGGAPTLTASSRTLGVDSGGSVAAGATVTLTNSTLNGAGILASQGTLNLQNTTVNSGLSNLGLLVVRSNTTLNGSFTTGPVSTLRVEGDASCCSAFVTVANGFTNNGTIDLTAINGASGTSAALTVTNGSLTNAAGGHINSLPGTGGARTLTAQLANQGTVTVSAPLTINHGSAAHTNSGTIALAANLTLNQSGVSPSFTHSGTLTIPAGDTLILNSGAFNYTGGTIGGLGAVTFSSVTLALTPALTNDTLTLSFTNSTVNGPGTLGNAATRTLFAQNATFNGPVDNQGVLRARAGTTFNGSLTTSASSTLRVEGDAACCSAFVTVANGFTNNGTIDLTAINGASGTSAALTVTNGSLTNAPGGHINSLPGTGGARTLTAQLANQGTVTVSAPLTINHGSAAHTNSGTIALAANLTLNQSGVSPSFTHSGTLAIPAGDTLILNSGAFNYTGGTIGGLGAITFSSVTLALTPNLVNDTLSLSFTNSTVNGPGTLANAATRTLFAQNATFNGPVDNQGVLRARASTTFNGSLTTSASSTLRVEGDASCCSAFVTVANGFTNNGTIDLTAINGASGTSAALTVTNGSLTNTVGAHINSLPGTGGARTLTAQLANQGTLTVSAPLTINHGSAAHTNSGTIALAANLTLNQSGVSPSFTHSGTLTIPAGDTLILNSGAFNYTGGTIGGLGAITLSSVTLALTPDLTNDTLTLSFTNSTVNGPGTLANAATRTLFAQNATFNGPVVNNGVLRARSSTVFNGSLTTSVGSTLRVEGDAACCAAFVTVANGFTNNGAIDLTAINGASGTTAGLTVTSGSLTNAAGASINSLAGTGGSRTLTAQLVNLGTLAVSQPLTINHGSATHTNSGTITVAANLTVNQSGTTPSFTNGGAISVGTGDTLTITSGTFTQNAGTLGGAGALELSSVNPAAFNTAHSLGSIILLNTTVSFSTAQSTAATQWGITNSTVNGPITFTNNAGRSLTVQGATFNTAFDNQGALTLRASSSLTGTLTTGGASSLVVQGDAACCAAFATIANGFTNNGTIDLTAINGASGTTAQLTVTSGTLTNAPGAIITSSAGTGGARTLAVALNNQGTLTVAQPLTMNLSAAVHTNGSTGVINITGGDLTLNQGGVGPSFTNLGTINLPSGRTWTVTGGAWTHSGPTLGSGGALVLSSVNPAAFNTAHTLGAITLTNTTASFALDQTTATTAFTLTNSTVNGPGTLTNASGKTLVIQGGTLNTALINQNLVTLRGSLTLNDTVNTSPGTILRIEGDASCCAAFVTVANGFTNRGTIALTAINGTGTTANFSVTNGTLVNAAIATIDVQAGNGGARQLNVALDNQGTMTVSQALTMNKGSADIGNAGLIKLSGGDMTVTESGTRPGFGNTGTIDVGTNKLVVNGTGSFVTQGGGILRGSGTFDIATPNISFITNGTTIVGGGPGVGTLNWVGTYLQGPDPSVFQVDVGGLATNPGVDYDQFVGTDNVTLQGGTLNVNLTGPVSGQRYVIMRLPVGKTFTGDFQVKNIDPVPKCAVGPVANEYVINCP
jgi:hypothetical protein